MRLVKVFDYNKKFQIVSVEVQTNDLSMMDFYLPYKIQASILPTK